MFYWYRNDAATEDKISKSVPTIDEGNRRESKVRFVSNQRMDDWAQITVGTNPSNDDNTFSSKIPTQPKIHMSSDENICSSKSPYQPIIHTCMSADENTCLLNSPSKPKAHMSSDENTSSSKSPSKPKVHMYADEKKLILKYNIKQKIKSDWDKLTETVFSHRRDCLPRLTIEHYEKNLTKATLKQRIKSFIQSAKRGKKENEKDPEVVILISKIIRLTT